MTPNDNANQFDSTIARAATAIAHQTLEREKVALRVPEEQFNEQRAVQERKLETFTTKGELPEVTDLAALADRAKS